MCGICGAINYHTSRPELEAATNLMRHRGPDDAGYYLDEYAALGMRRLRIIDLAGGSQPKTDENGRLQLIFNGEIYNYRELRDQLRAAGHTFRSESDTEVIVHAYEEWGADAFVRLNGIFAVAIWDPKVRRLVLARDHLGIKPLYYRHEGNRLAFGSELKPLLGLLPERPELDPESAILYLRYQYVPGPRSIYQGVRKLPPGHCLWMDAEGNTGLQRFWEPAGVPHSGPTDVDEAREYVHDLLRAAVRRQMVSDVPLGAFLSGGVDSSTVVALMQESSNAQIETFSIGFTAQSVDESSHAQAVGSYLNTAHHAWTITEAEALDVVPQLPHYFDEPFADPSMVPTFLVSQLARRYVTVSLSGDGGDELFGGYEIYARLRRANLWWTLPEPARYAALGALSRVKPVRGADILSQPTRSEAYRNLMSVTRTDALVSLANDRDVAVRPNREWPSDLFDRFGLDDAMMLTDLQTYLPDDILTKVDRSSMANSLEARVPILDMEVVNGVLGIPAGVRMHTGPKALLKDILYQHVPRTIVDRPKQGFAVPLDDWLRCGLRDLVLAHMSEDALGEHGLFNVAGARKILRDHLSGTRNNGQTLWALLMFQVWYAYQKTLRRPLAMS